MTKDLTRYATAKPTETMEAFADFLIEKVYGGALPDGIDEAAFRTGVSLGGSTRGYFQASDEWKADSRNYLANVDANRAAKAVERAERAKIAAKKASEREAAAIAKLEELVAKAAAKAASLAGEVADESADESVSPDATEPASGTSEPTEPTEPTESAPKPTAPKSNRERRAA